MSVSAADRSAPRSDRKHVLLSETHALGTRARPHVAPAGAASLAARIEFQFASLETPLPFLEMSTAGPREV